jgi:hypothetical protein
MADSLFCPEGYSLLGSHNIASIPHDAAPWLASLNIVAVKDDNSKGDSKGDSCEDSVRRSSLDRLSTLTANFFADGLWVDSNYLT